MRRTSLQGSIKLEPRNLSRVHVIPWCLTSDAYYLASLQHKSLLLEVAGMDETFSLQRNRGLLARQKRNTLTTH